MVNVWPGWLMLGSSPLKMHYGSTCESKGVQPLLMVCGHILHNILLGILKHLMSWIEQFLKKHRRLEVFNKIWEQIPPYSRYRPPQKRYRQVTIIKRRPGWTFLQPFHANLSATNQLQMRYSFPITVYHMPRHVPHTYIN